VDAKRMLWVFRRPIPFIVQDIGMWEYIVEFLNICGVISNAFIITFTSAWGKNYTLAWKVIIVLIIEHAVFALKFIIAAVIPDVPREVELSIRREKYQVQKIIDEGDVNAVKQSPNKTPVKTVPLESQEMVLQQRVSPMVKPGALLPISFNVNELQHTYEIEEPVQVKKHRKKKKNKLSKERHNHNALDDEMALHQVSPDHGINTIAPLPHDSDLDLIVGEPPNDPDPPLDAGAPLSEPNQELNYTYPPLNDEDDPLA